MQSEATRELLKAWCLANGWLWPMCNSNTTWRRMWRQCHTQDINSLSFNELSERPSIVVQAYHLSLNISYTLENQHGTWKSPVWKGKSSSKPSFSGFHVSFHGCIIDKHDSVAYSRSHHSKICQIFSSFISFFEYFWFTFFGFNSRWPILGYDANLGCKALDEIDGNFATKWLFDWDA